MTRVRVVVPHYGAAELAERLVAQLLPQLAAANAELVVVDDASPTPYPVAADPRVTVVRRARNGGFGSAVNTGAEGAESDLLLFLNSDLEVGPTFLTDLLVAYGPGATDVAAPAVLAPSGAPSRTGRHWLTPEAQALSWIRPAMRLAGRPWFLDLIGIDHRARPGATVAVDWISGAVLLVPRAVFAAVGGFDERYYMYAEELDLQRRLTQAGHPARYLGTVSVVHTGGGSTDPDRARSWLVGSIRRYLIRWGGHRRLQVLLTVASVVNLAWNLARRAAGADVRPLDALRAELDLAWSRRHLEDPRARPPAR